MAIGGLTEPAGTRRETLANLSLPHLAAGDYFVTVGLVNRDRRLEHGGDVRPALCRHRGATGQRGRALALADGSYQLGCRVGLFGVGLEDRHGLCAQQDALQTRDRRVLTGDEYLARQTNSLERLHSSATKVVVGGVDHGELVAGERQRSLNLALAIRGVPVGGELLIDVLELAAADQRIEDTVAALREEVGVVVGVGALDDGDVVVAILSDVLLVVVSDVLALQLANLHVVERDVVGEVVALDQAVIGDDRHVVLLGSSNNRGGGDAIMRRDHQDAVTTSQVGLSLRLLGAGAAVGVVVVNAYAWQVLFERGDQQRMVVPFPAGR